MGKQDVKEPKLTPAQVHKKTWQALKDLNKGFTKPLSQFERDMENPETRTKVHKYLTDNKEGFTMPEDKFELIHGYDPLKKKVGSSELQPDFYGVANEQSTGSETQSSEYANEQSTGSETQSSEYAKAPFFLEKEEQQEIDELLNAIKPEGYTPKGDNVYRAPNFTEEISDTILPPRPQGDGSVLNTEDQLDQAGLGFINQIAKQQEDILTRTNELPMNTRLEAFDRNMETMKDVGASLDGLEKQAEYYTSEVNRLDKKLEGMSEDDMTYANTVQKREEALNKLQETSDAYNALRERGQMLASQNKAIKESEGFENAYSFKKLNTGQGRFSNAMSNINRGFYGTFISDVPRTINNIQAYVNNLPGRAAKDVMEFMGADRKKLEKAFPDQKPEELLGYKLAEGYDKIAEELFPTNPALQEEFLSSQLPHGAGNLAAYALAGGMTSASRAGASTASKTVAQRLGNTPAAQKMLTQNATNLQIINREIAGMMSNKASQLGMMQIMSQTYTDAKKNGKSDDEAFMISLLDGIPGGMSEGIPLAIAFRRLDRVTGGGVKEMLAKGTAGGLEEGAQEVWQQGYSNLIAEQFYDKTREWTEGLMEGGSVGFTLGFLLNGMGNALRSMQLKAQDEKARKEIQRTLDYVDDLYMQLIGSPMSNKEMTGDIAIQDEETTEQPGEGSSDTDLGKEEPGSREVTEDVGDVSEGGTGTGVEQGGKESIKTEVTGGEITETEETEDESDVTETPLGNKVRLRPNESVVYEQEDSKGRVVSYIQQEEDAGSMRIFDFFFNRSDKDPDQRNRKFVPIENTMLKDMQPVEGSVPEGVEVTGVDQIRVEKGNVAATVQMTDKEGKSFEGEVKYEDSSKPSTKDVHVVETAKETDMVKKAEEFVSYVLKSGAVDAADLFSIQTATLTIKEEQELERNDQEYADLMKKDEEGTITEKERERMQEIYKGQQLIKQMEAIINVYQTTGNEKYTKVIEDYVKAGNVLPGIEIGEKDESQFTKGTRVELTENYLGTAKGMQGTIEAVRIIDGKKHYQVDLGKNAGGNKMTAKIPAEYLTTVEDKPTTEAPTTAQIANDEKVRPLVNNLNTPYETQPEDLAPDKITENGNRLLEQRLKKDIRSYSKSLAQALGWEHDTDKKGKPDYGNTNLAPIGGDATFILWKPNSEYGVYVDAIYDRENQGDDNESIQLIPADMLTGPILWRITTKDKKYTGLANQYLPKFPLPSEFAELIKTAQDSYEKSAQRVKNPDFKQEILDATNPIPDEATIKEITIKERIKEKRKKVQKKLSKEQQELLDMLNEFGKNEGLMTGVDPKQIALAGNIIAKAAKVGYTKFEDVMLFALENMDLDMLVSMFDSFKRAYVAGLPFDSDESTDAIRKTSIESIQQKYLDNETITETEPNQGVATDEQSEGETTVQTTGTTGGQDTNDANDIDQERGDGDQRTGDSVRGGDVTVSTGGSTGNTDVNKGLHGTTDNIKIKQPGEGVVKPTRNGNNFVIPEDFAHEPFNVKRRFNDNIAALEVLVDIEKNKRHATPEEQDILFRYVGWGGLKEIRYKPDNLPDHLKEYGDAVDKSRELITEFGKLIGYDQALEDAIASTSNAHYTPVPVIRAIYDGIKQLGFKSGRILEPSAGVGHFIGAMPINMVERSEITGVEMDPITGKILENLYPDSNVRIDGLQKTNLPVDYYDLVISNVPFGKIRAYDPSWKNTKESAKVKAQAKVHNYFFAKGLELIRPGGLMAFITSKGVMDSDENQFIRDYIQDNAEFLGAVRLPSQTFQKNANTQVTTDLIFLRKLEDGEQPTGKAFNEKGSIVLEGTPMRVNNYFIQNPDNVLGDYELGGMYGAGADFKLVNKNPETIPDQIQERLQEMLPQKIYKRLSQSVANRYEPVVYSGDETNIKSGNIVEENGQFGMMEISKDKLGNFTKRIDPINVNKKDVPLVKRFIKIRNTRNALAKAELEDSPKDVVDQLRDQLNKDYDVFVSKHGRLNTPTVRKILQYDVDQINILALEVYDQETGKFKRKADIFNKRTIKPIDVVEQEDDPNAAVFISIAEKGMIDVDRVEELTGRDFAELMEDELAGKVFERPEGGYEHATTYLAGNVKKKLKQAQAAAKINDRFKTNVKFLETVIPEDKDPVDIITKPSTQWVPDIYKSQFLNHLTGDPNAEVISALDAGSVNVKVSWDYYEQLRKYEAGGKYGREVIEFAFLDKYHKVTYKNADGQTILDVEKTEEIENMVNQIKEQWNDWIWQDVNRTEKLSRLFNDTFRTTVAPTFDGSYLKFPGISSDWNFRQHQKDAIQMLLHNVGGIVDHVVGAGKTGIIVGAIMEMKRLGIARKPAILAKKANYLQIVEAFKKLYPNAKVLYPRKGVDFSKQNREKMLAQIANNDWDAVIMTHENYKTLKHNEQIMRDVLREQTEPMRAAMAQLEEQGADKRQLGRLQDRIENLEEKIQSELEKGTSNVYTLDQLGIDHLMVDESHVYKNLMFATTHGQIKGLDPTGNINTTMLLMGVRQMQKLHGADKGVTFLSGTTITNSVAEMYNILKYLRPRKMNELGFHTFDAWADTFADSTPDFDVSVGGTIKNERRFRGFFNGIELSLLYREIADVRNHNNLTLPGLPKIKGGEPQLVAAKPTDDQMRYFRNILEAYKSRNLNILGIYDENKEKAFGLTITDLGTKSSLDMRMIDPDYDGPISNKLLSAFQNIKNIYEATKKDRGTQLVFLDMGVPGGSTFNMYGLIIDELTNTYGIPANEIDYIQRHNTDAKRDALFTKVNNGEIRILLGNRRAMGTGVNVQERSKAQHHLDVPWKPEEYEQPLGRTHRQGNMFEEIEAYYYSTQNSVDQYRMSLVKTKANMIGQTKQEEVVDKFEESSDDIVGYAQMQAAVSGNDVFLRQAKANAALKKIEGKHRQYKQKMMRANMRKQQAEEALSRLEPSLEKFKADKEYYDSKKKLDAEGKVEFELVVDGKMYTKSDEAGQAIKEWHDKFMKSNPRLGETRVLGQIYGTDVIGIYDKHDLADGKTAQGIRYKVKAPSGVNYRSRTETIQGLTQVDGNIGRIPLGAISHIDKMVEHNTENIQEEKNAIKVSDEILQETFPDADKIAELQQQIKDIEAEVKAMADSGESNIGGTEEDVDTETDQDDVYSKKQNAPKKGRNMIGDYEKRDNLPEVNPDEKFHLMDEIIKFIRKYASNSTLGQDGMPHNTYGVFYTKSKAVRVKGMNDFETAMHELTHAIDQEHNIVKRIIDETGHGDKFRKRLTDIYEELYPGAKREHSLQRRMTEGLAVFFEAMVTDPSWVRQKYEDLHNELVKENGRFTFPQVREFINDIESFVMKYQAATPKQKIQAFLANPETDVDWRISKQVALEMELFDKFHFIEKLDREDGVLFTTESLADELRFGDRISQFAVRNVTGVGHNKGLWTFNDDGEIGKALNHNYFDLVDKLKKRGLQDDFASWLVARRVHFDYEYLHEMEERLEELQKIYEDNDKREADGLTKEQWNARYLPRIKSLKDQIKEQWSVIENTGIDESTATALYEEDASKFVEEEKMFDQLQAATLAILNNPMVQLLDDDGYAKLSNIVGYAPFRRQFYDEIVGNLSGSMRPVNMKANSKVSSMMRRKGSMKPIINPLVGAMMNHVEIMRKASRQMAYNKVLGVAERHPDMFNIESPRMLPGGKMAQESDPNYVIARKNFKKVPIRVGNEFKTVLDSAYIHENSGWLERVVVGFARMFTAGTTGFFWQFALTTNFIVDQVSVGLHSQTGMIPFASSAKEISRALIPGSEENKLLREYVMISGLSQTLGYAHKRGYTDFAKQINENTKWYHTALDIQEYVADVLSFPGASIEIASRATEYIRARKQGVPQKSALSMAGNVSGPFHHIGAWGGRGGKSGARGYVRSVPYMNAAFQIFKQFSNTMRNGTKDDQLAGVKRLALYYGLVGSSIAGMMAWNMNDDDYKEQFVELSGKTPEQLTRHLHILNPIGKHTVKFRVPEFLGWLVADIQMLALEMAGKAEYDAEDYLAGPSQMIPEQFKIYKSVMFWNQQAQLGWIASIMPQIIKPIVETGANVKTFPSPRNIENPYTDLTKLPEHRYNEYTSWVARALGEEFKLSPKMIDHLILGYVGRSAKYVLQPKGFDWLGIKNAFNGQLYFEGSRQLQTFYEIREANQQYKGSYKARLIDPKDDRYPVELRRAAYIYTIENYLEVIKNANIDMGSEDVRAEVARYKIFQKIKELERLEK